MSPSIRPEFALIADRIKPSSRVLDLGCGDGALLKHLHQHRQIRGYGVEISDDSVLACVQNGVNVIQTDLEAGLSAFESGSFDYVILSHTLQTMRNVNSIMAEMLRVGREGIVTFPNFGYWRHRMQVIGGRMPVSRSLPYQWFDTPNVHLCTLNDFEEFCSSRGIRILERVVMTGGQTVGFAPNLLGSLAVYRFEKLG